VIDDDLPHDTVVKIPQRFRYFNEISPGREEFWGLRAQEQHSALRGLLYALLIFLPMISFCFVYLFHIGGLELDLQDATTPLTLSLTSFGLFIAWLLKK